MIKLLRDCRILSLTDFLQNVAREDEVQAIIGDVIDADEHHDQLAEIIKTSVTGHAICIQFDTCFRQYCADCIDRSELIKKEFIGGMEEQLTSDVYCTAIVIKLIDVLMNHEMLKETQVTEVIGLQKQWNSQFDCERFILLTRILQKISVNHSEAILKHLLKDLQTNYKVNWFFLLCIINFIKQATSVQNELKALLKGLFQKFYETRDVDHLVVMMIIARQAYHFKNEASVYKSWLRSTIGEMHYSMKCHEKFTQTLVALQSIVFLETDLEILDIHAQTAITPPRGLNNTVLEYKQLLKTKIASISRPEIDSRPEFDP